MTVGHLAIGGWGRCAKSLSCPRCSFATASIGKVLQSFKLLTSKRISLVAPDVLHVSPHSCSVSLTLLSRMESASPRYATPSPPRGRAEAVQERTEERRAPKMDVDSEEEKRVEKNVLEDPAVGAGYFRPYRIISTYICTTHMWNIYIYIYIYYSQKEHSLYSRTPAKKKKSVAFSEPQSAPAPPTGNVTRVQCSHTKE